MLSNSQNSLLSIRTPDGNPLQEDTTSVIFVHFFQGRSSVIPVVRADSVFIQQLVDEGFPINNNGRMSLSHCNMSHPLVFLIEFMRSVHEFHDRVFRITSSGLALLKTQPMPDEIKGGLVLDFFEEIPDHSDYRSPEVSRSDSPPLFLSITSPKASDGTAPQCPSTSSGPAFFDRSSEVGSDHLSAWSLTNS